MQSNIPCPAGINSSKKGLPDMEIKHTATKLDVDDTDLSASTFHNASLAGAKFTDINLANALFEEVNFTDTKIHNVNLSNVQITDCNLAGMTIEGISVTEMIAAYKK